MRVRFIGALLLVAGSLVFSSPPASAAATLRVTPSTGLVNLQTVEVVATGFRPNVEVGACQTVLGYTAQRSYCAPESVVTGFADDTGARTFPVPVRRFAYIPALDRSFDCADPASSCAIGAAEVADIGGTFGVHDIQFATPPPPATPGAITVTPAAIPGESSEVAVQGSGFRPDVDVEVVQCVAAPQTPYDCDRDRVTVRTDATGSFATSLTVGREFSGESARRTDCAVTPCAVAASESVDFPGTLATASISFEPPPAPEIVATPSTGLRPGDVVTVTGVRFEPGVEVSAAQCTTSGSCGPGSSVVADGDGTFTVALTMVDNADDCWRPSASCSIQADQSADEDGGVSAPISFAGPGQVPVIVPGHASVVEGDAGSTSLGLSLTLSAPSPHRIDVDYSTIYDPAWDSTAAVPGSDYLPHEGGVTFEPGETEVSMAVDILGDTVAEPGELVVVSFQHADGLARMGGFWGLGIGGITDDDSGARLRVSQDTIEDQGEVTVEGMGFRPDVDVVVDQCVAAPQAPADCVGDHEMTVRTDASGSFTTTLTVFREISVSSGNRNCGLTSCVVAASEPGDFPGTLVTAELTFEPPIVHPEIVATPATGLGSGDVVTVTGVDFDPGIPVIVMQCMTSGSCGPITETTADDDGTIAVELTMVDNGDDCWRPSASCEIYATEPFRWYGFDRVPISYAGPGPVIVPGHASVAEGDDGPTQLTLPLTLSSPLPVEVVVDYHTTFDTTWDNSAAEPEIDYPLAMGTVVFPPGETETSITIDITGDTVAEPDELLVVSYQHTTYARMGGFWGLGFGGITDDDTPAP